VSQDQVNIQLNKLYSFQCTIYYLVMCNWCLKKWAIPCKVCLMRASQGFVTMTLINSFRHSKYWYLYNNAETLLKFYGECVDCSICQGQSPNLRTILYSHLCNYSLQANRGLLYGQHYMNKKIQPLSLIISSPWENQDLIFLNFLQILHHL